jgi:hypothetical protein
MGDMIITVTYDGTNEGVETLVLNLGLSPLDYSFNPVNKEIHDYKHGLIYRPNDCYNVRINEKFECI